MNNPWEITLRVVSITSVTQVSADEWRVTVIIRRSEFDGRISLDSFSSVVNIRHEKATSAPFGVSLDGLCYVYDFREATRSDDYGLSKNTLRKCYSVVFRGNDLKTLNNLNIPAPTEVALGRRLSIWPDPEASI